MPLSLSIFLSFRAADGDDDGGDDDSRRTGLYNGQERAGRKKKDRKKNIVRFLHRSRRDNKQRKVRLDPSATQGPLGQQPIPALTISATTKSSALSLFRIAHV